MLDVLWQKLEASGEIDLKPYVRFLEVVISSPWETRF